MATKRHKVAVTAIYGKDLYPGSIDWSNIKKFKMEPGKDGTVNVKLLLSKDGQKHYAPVLYDMAPSVLRMSKFPEEFCRMAEQCLKVKPKLKRRPVLKRRPI